MVCGAGRELCYDTSDRSLSTQGANKRMRRIFLPVVVLCVSLWLTACSTPTTEAPTSAPDAATAPDVDVAETDSATASNSALAVPRPSEPAAPDEWREDHPSHVANTGRPQLLDFFAHT
jgi:hypothetical protein